MKILLLFALLVFTSLCRAQYKPDTMNHPDGLISAVAAKFSDVYCANPARESDFSFGSSAEEELRKINIEEIRFILPDGFVKTFSFLPHPERKVKSIQYTNYTTSIIYYTDGSTSDSELLVCPDRPIAYQIITKGTDLKPVHLPDITVPRLNIPITDFPLSIPDGSAIVLKKNNVIAVVYITNQQNKGETCDYEWYLRTDGKVLFDDNDEGLQKGHGTTKYDIIFKPFVLRRTANVDGRGFVRLSKDYYLGVVVGPNRQDIQKRILGTIMLKNLQGDTCILPFMPQK